MTVVICVELTAVVFVATLELTAAITSNCRAGSVIVVSELTRLDTGVVFGTMMIVALKINVSAIKRLPLG